MSTPDRPASPPGATGPALGQPDRVHLQRPESVHDDAELG